MPSDKKRDYEVGYGKPPRHNPFYKRPIRQSSRLGAGREKPEDIADRRALRAGRRHREWRAANNQQRPSHHQVARQPIGQGRLARRQLLPDRLAARKRVTQRSTAPLRPC